jgi:hypothetical protein
VLVPGLLLLRRGCSTSPAATAAIPTSCGPGISGRQGRAICRGGELAVPGDLFSFHRAGSARSRADRSEPGGAMPGTDAIILPIRVAGVPGRLGRIPSSALRARRTRPLPWMSKISFGLAAARSGMKALPVPRQVADGAPGTSWPSWPPSWRPSSKKPPRLGEVAVAHLGQRACSARRSNRPRPTSSARSSCTRGVSRRTELRRLARRPSSSRARTAASFAKALAS